ncbi:dehypoxanthine futalosine cyclase [Persephonella atlantica]|uniref:Cyclic dehypoxanthine futalosine synthase n=1 Tax=Persephonella atlantica TaxID=2699429 RepID=A0ABS1GJR6_9AQUI|nr:cyclic dehypoxanthinyl futalosine synthase [Persephonella atlantica]MBK3332982.1 dehypoxanthine futalosine cyclase [Persephonella atlantica]
MKSAVDLKMEHIYEKVFNGERIREEEALFLLKEADLLTVGRLADYVRRRKHPDNLVTFVVDRNVNYTNVCVAGCKFCAFQTKVNSPDAYTLDFEEIYAKIQELVEWGGTTLLMQGGLNPQLRIDFYVQLFKGIKERFPQIQIHSLSASEIFYISKLEGISIKDVLKILQEAGLDSVPGGGAEILSDEIRVQISSNKVSTQTWLEVHRSAHQLGMKTTATMMFGHVEKPEHIIEHLSRIRELQDESLKEERGYFTAFIPWTFQKGGTKLDHIETATTVYYLKVLAVSRIFLDNFDNIQSSHVTQTMKVGPVGLHFGANDLGSTMIEENVVASTGWKVAAPKPEKMADIIRKAGFKPAQRDTYYNIVRYF